MVPTKRILVPFTNRGMLDWELKPILQDKGAEPTIFLFLRLHPPQQIVPYDCGKLYTELRGLHNVLEVHGITAELDVRPGRAASTVAEYAVQRDVHAILVPHPDLLEVADAVWVAELLQNAPRPVQIALTEPSPVAAYL